MGSTEIRLLGLEFPYDQTQSLRLSHLSVGHALQSGVLSLYAHKAERCLAVERTTGID